jgi:hypothetical protein
MPRIKKKPTIPAPDRADDVVECVGTILTSAGRYTCAEIDSAAMIPPCLSCPTSSAIRRDH